MRDVFNLKNNQIILNDDNDIRKVYIELTNACNFSCKMCFKNTFVEPEGFMDAQTIEKLKETLKELPHLKEVVLGGIGESLLHKDVKNIISFLKDELGVYVILATNGFLLDRFSDFILQKQVDNVVVSADNTSIGHLHNSVVYKTVEKIIKQRKQRELDKPVLSVEIVVDKESIGGLADIVAEFINIGIRDVIISNLLPVDKKYIDRTLYPSDEKSILDELIALAQGNISMTLPYFSLKTERKCNFIDKKSLVVRWDGKVAPCYRFLHTAKEYVLGREKTLYAHTFGDINKETLLEIWNKRNYKWFRFTVDNSMYPSCLDCNFNEMCSFVKDTEVDCWGGSPSCADCLWSRNIVICP